MHRVPVLACVCVRVCVGIHASYLGSYSMARLLPD